VRATQCGCHVRRAGSSEALAQRFVCSRVRRCCGRGGASAHNRPERCLRFHAAASAAQRARGCRCGCHGVLRGRRLAAARQRCVHLREAPRQRGMPRVQRRCERALRAQHGAQAQLRLLARAHAPG
jgi:hypothetical protein